MAERTQTPAEAIFNREIGNLSPYELRISKVDDLKIWLAHLQTNPEISDNRKHEITRLAESTKNMFMFSLEAQKESDPNIHNRKSVFIETTDGKRAFVSVVLYGQTDSNWYFGGAGIYPPPEGEDSKLGFAVKQSEKLARTMLKKAHEIGVSERLAGTKVIIEGKDWIQNPTLQQLTGLLFSTEGPFPNIITGSDAGQTHDSIANMEFGSRLGNGVGQIVGTENGLPNTASYVKYSMESTYRQLRERLPTFKLPPIKGSIASIQGLGKIGSSAAELFIDQKAASIYITDIALFPNFYPNITAEQATRAQEALERLKQKAAENGTLISVVHPDTIWDQDTQIFVPNTSQEHIITKTKIIRLAKSGVKVILSGANHPFDEPQTATFAQEKFGIISPPEVLANGGSATAAAFEPDYLRRKHEFESPGQFVNEILAPHIERNTGEKLDTLIAIMRTHQTSLYNAGEIAFSQRLQN